jgi:hypothetical protein
MPILILLTQWHQIFRQKKMAHDKDEAEYNLYRVKLSGECFVYYLQ